MNTTSAKVVCDSITVNGDRLVTLECLFARFILAELNTHRDFSRNSASSRAIPLAKQIAKVLEDPFIPIEFGLNRPGMQSSEVLSGSDLNRATRLWLEARDESVKFARTMGQLYVHKQVVNRLLEPFMWHTAVISSTEWDNFFLQRLSKHGMAQPEMGALADAIKAAIDGSTPTVLRTGQWHTPYIRDEDADLTDAQKAKVSVARCARVSYLNHDGTRSIEDDLGLFDKLFFGQHRSPSEHVATPAGKFEKCANFRGWKQLRWYAERGLVDEALSVIG